MLSKNHAVRIRPATWHRGLLFKSFLSLSIFSLGFIGAGLYFPAPNVNTELRCNEGTGTTIADASGNGHTVTLTNGPSWIAGKDGQGINLDGVNDYINIALCHAVHRVHMTQTRPPIEFFDS